MKDVNKVSLGRLLFAIWWTVLPLLVVQKWEFGYELPKMFWLFVGAIILFVISFWERNWRFRGDLKIIGLLIVWLILLNISSIKGVAVDKMWWGTVPRWQGVFFYVFLVLLIVSNNGYKRGLLQGWLLSLFITVIMGVTQQVRWWSNIPVVSYAGRMVSSFGEPNYWSDFLLVGWTWWRLSQRKWDKWKWLVTLTVIIGLALSRSKINLVLLVILEISYVFNKKRRMVLGLLMVLVLALGVQVGWFDERLAFWTRSIEKISERPITGYGLETIGQVLQGFDFGNGHQYWVDRSHNLILDMGLYAGVGGMLVWLWLNLTVLKKFWERKEEGMFYGFLVWHILGLVHVVGVVSFAMWALMVGEAVEDKMSIKRIKVPFWGLIVVVSYGYLLFKLLLGNFKVWLN